MTVIKQDEAYPARVGKLIAKLNDLTLGLIEAASLYKECVEHGDDVSRWVSLALCEKLSIIADGRLIDPIVNIVQYLPNKAVTALAALPKSLQKAVWEDGVNVGGEIRKIPDLRSADVGRVFDVVDGRGRIISPEEQAVRAVPVRPKHDKIFEVRLTPVEYESLVRRAAKAGTSPQRCFKSWLNE